MVIEGNGPDDENEIHANSFPYNQYDRNVPSTSMFNNNYGDDRVPMNDVPSEYYSYKYRSAKTKVPNNKTVESQFGLTRTPEDKAVVFEPNVFGNSYQEMLYPSHYGGYVRSTPRARGRPVIDKSSAADVSVRSQSRIQSLSARDPSLDLSRSYSEIPKGMKRTAQSVPLSVRLGRKSDGSKDPKKADDARPAKYTHTVEEPKLVTSEDFRPAKYTYTKDEKDSSNDADDTRPAKYTYTISSPPAKDRMVSFKDDVGKSGKKSEDTKKQTANSTSNSSKQNGILKSGGLHNGSEQQPRGRNSVSKSSMSNTSLVRKSWSPPVEEYDDPRKFWVDIGGNSDDSKHAKKPRGSRTPRKSKRMAAKLDGHSSTETDNSKSITDSTDHSKPPVSQARSSKDPQGGDKEGKEVVSPVESKGTEAAGLRVEDSMLGTQDSDDIPMLQKLKEMNQNTKDQKRKKDVPKWLKQEEVPGPFENPVDSQPSSKPEETATPARPSSGKRPGTDKRQGTGERDAKQGTKESNSRPDSGRRPGSEKSILPTKDHMKQTHQEDVDMLIDEELAMNWPEKGVPHLNTVFDKEKVVEKPQTNESSTPMQKIQQNRAKWRDNQKKNLEESWGQLNMFDRHQKGRISMDLDDDALDEYLQPSKKAAPQPSIKEEEDDEKAALAAVEEELDMDNFVIPELPYGRELVIDIKSTWGDRHYVGLTGIELFSSTGEPVTTTKIHANPLDINILSEYEKDPRVINNLIDGVNRTRDDVHMWLAPFTPNGHHYIYITFEKACKISLMRIWNYNKSRIHSYRGAKDVVITLDSTEIFKGEIARACGGIEGGTEAFGDTILFTTDETILEAVSKNDDAYEGDLFSDDEPDDVPFERPSTADEGSDDERPFTRAAGNLKKAEKESASIPPRPATSMVTEGDVIVFKGKRLELNFTATWGDLHYLGLTGIEVVGKEGEALSVNLNMITATPRDLHHLQGHERDDRTLDKSVFCLVF
ncbi:hypothetical protein FSP39_017488 [Pinctada imbricata]|uniref:KATNIP domain-containing protein n=1 Tax=Pinctada imbricata TaxID=66713 RepID=A0AA88XSP0_PINIB|nr:hypothetical protein FSP39_017488 [Pinctada imbricata]